MNANKGASLAISALSDHSRTLLEMAKRYRAVMDEIDKSDPRCSVYEKVILEILKEASKMAEEVLVICKP